ncbi:MAG: hypothetical protein ABUJ93_12315 [Hyphomicrobium sp.]|jgi:hypothetical protein
MTQEFNADTILALRKRKRAVRGSSVAERLTDERRATSQKQKRRKKTGRTKQFNMRLREELCAQIDAWTEAASKAQGRKVLKAEIIEEALELYRASLKGKKGA